MNESIVQHLRRSGLLDLSLLLCVAGGFFLGFDSLGAFWTLVAQEASILGVLSLGLLVLHHAGEFDFSVDAIFACSLVLIGFAARSVPAELACVLGVVAAAAIGMINGVLAMRLRVTLLLTFALAVLWRQMAQLMTDGRPFTVAVSPNSLISSLAWDSFLGVPVSFWLLLLLALSVRVFLAATTPGHNLVAIGLDPQKARLLGLNVLRYKRGAFLFSGLMAGLAAALYFGRLTTADANAGSKMTFLALGSIVIANSGLSRTRPSPLRLVLAVCLISYLEVAASSQQGWPPIVNILVGIVIILALALSRGFSY